MRSSEPNVPASRWQSSGLQRLRRSWKPPQRRENCLRRSRRSLRGQAGLSHQPLRSAYRNFGGVGCLAPSGGSRRFLRPRFAAAGAIHLARLVDRPVRRVGASRLPRLSRQGVSLDAQGAGRRDTARCRAWTRPDLGRNGPLLERQVCRPASTPRERSRRDRGGVDRGKTQGKGERGEITKEAAWRRWRRRWFGN